MTRRILLPLLAFTCAATALGCDAHSSSSTSSTSGSPTVAAPGGSSWTDFYGIQYQAPAGTDAHVTRSVLPGPGGLGGSPTDERPDVTLSLAGSHGFYVQITKSKDAESLDGMTSTYVANKVGINHHGSKTSTGWELRYDVQRSDDPSKTSKVVLVYADLAGGHYECIYSDETSPDPAVADAICRSMRVKP